MNNEYKTDLTNYKLLKVLPHNQRDNCEKPFVCLAKISEKSTISENYVETHRISICLSIIESSYEEYSCSENVIKNPSFDICLTRYGEDEYTMKTLHFYVDTPWAKDRGLGKYMMIKILNRLKKLIKSDRVGELSFSLSASQAQVYEERLLRNYFYRSIGCSLKGYENNTKAWESAQDAKAILNLEMLPETWNEKKIEECDLGESLQNMYLNQKEMIREITGNKELIEYHKRSTTRIDKWRQIKYLSLVRLTQAAVVVVILWGILR